MVFQCLGISCWPALIKNFRRLFFCDLTVPGSMEIRAMEGEGASGLS